MVRATRGLLVAALLQLPLALNATAAPPANELGRKEQELSDLRANIQQLRDTLGAAKDERNRLTEELAKTEQAIGALARSVYDLATRIDAAQTRLEELEARSSRKQEQLAQQRSALGAQLRAAHVTGRQERLKMLLNQQDPGVLSRMMVYYEYLNRDRIESIQRIDSSIAELRSLQMQIQQEQAQLRPLRSLQEQQLQALERSQQERESVLAVLEADILSDDQRLSGMEQDEQRLETFLRDLERMLLELPLQSAGQVAFADLRGQLPWPASGRLATRFGSARKRGGRKWDGVVIDAREGTEVRAVHHGRVVFADWLRGLGLLIILDHGGGFMSLYGHNQSLFKEPGEWVAPGEVLGLAGRSGGQANPGVYFGIRKHGKPVNPDHWCKAPQQGRVG
jgi:septal ring factor EnvC (AmiA/AmiB activator)